MIPVHEPVWLADTASRSRPPHISTRTTIDIAESGADDRPGAFQGDEIQARWPIARRTSDDGDWRALAATHVLHGRCERRVVPNDRCRHDLDATLRRKNPAGFDGLDCRCRF